MLAIARLPHRARVARVAAPDELSARRTGVLDQNHPAPADPSSGRGGAMYRPSPMPKPNVLFERRFLLQLQHFCDEIESLWRALHVRPSSR